MDAEDNIMGKGKESDKLKQPVRNLINSIGNLLNKEIEGLSLDTEEHRWKILATLYRMKPADESQEGSVTRTKEGEDLGAESKCKGGQGRENPDSIRS